MRRLLLVTIGSIATAAGLPAAGEIDERSIADVAAGKLREARTSWWGFDSSDSTNALQAAIDSGVPKLFVDKKDGPWVVTPIRLVSGQEIVFEEGVEVLAKRGEFKGKGDSLFSAVRCKGITIRGYGATLRMWREDYVKPPYDKAEWRHALQLRSCTDVKVLGLTLAESGGDGIYLGTAGDGGPNRDVLIQDVVCDGNYRLSLTDVSEGGTRSVELSRAANLVLEDDYLDLLGAPPFLAAAPEAVLVPQE